jgi:hypothetical protein
MESLSLATLLQDALLLIDSAPIIYTARAAAPPY